MKKVSDKRAALIQAALELIAENGLAGSPTAMIAKRAGVANGTLFLYFKNKDELVRAVFEDVQSQLAGATGGFPGKLSIRERFVHLMTAFMQFFLANPNILIFCEYYHFSKYRDSQTNIHEPFRDLSKLLMQARTDGVVKDLPDFVLESIAIAPLVAIAKEHVSRGAVIDDELAEHIVQASWDALEK